MHARHMVAHLGAQVVLLLVAAGLLALLGPSPTQAGDGPVAQVVQRDLLIKCDAPEVPKVLAALGPLKVHIYDVRTMKQIHVPGCPAAVTPLPDAVQAMAALREALASVTANTRKPLRLVELQVTPQRLTASVELAGPDLADAIPKALGDHGYFAGRKARMQLGAMSRKQDRWSLRIQLDLGTPSREAKPVTQLFDHLPTLDLHRLERESGLERLHMSSEKLAYDNRRSVRTISRAVTYQAGLTLDELTGFLGRLGRETALTVTELRWKLDDVKAGEKLGKVVLRVTLQAPLQR